MLSRIKFLKKILSSFVFFINLYRKANEVKETEKFFIESSFVAIYFARHDHN